MLAMAVTNSGVILVIGVNHHDDVCSCSQGLTVAGLLVSTVSIILIVDKNLQA